MLQWNDFITSSGVNQPVNSGQKSPRERNGKIQCDVLPIIIIMFYMFKWNCWISNSGLNHHVNSSQKRPSKRNSKIQWDVLSIIYIIL